MSYINRMFCGGITVLIIQTIFNTFIPSGSDQVYVNKSLMGPLDDLVGVPGQVAVLAHQFGNGFGSGFIYRCYLNCC